MISFLIGLGFLVVMLWLGFKLTGALLAACVWMFVSIPLGLGAIGIGLLMCLTIVLMPLGMWFFKVGIKLLLPGI